MNIDINSLSEDELLALNSKIVKRINFIEEAKTHAAMMSFNLGDEVVFYPENRGEITGKIVKYNKKTVVVISDSGEKWKVHARALKKKDDDDVINITPTIES